MNFGLLNLFWLGFSATLIGKGEEFSVTIYICVMINSANPNCLGLSCLFLKERKRNNTLKSIERFRPSKREEKKLFFDSTL